MSKSLSHWKRISNPCGLCSSFFTYFYFKKNHKLTEDDLNDIYGKIQTETPQRDYTYTFPLKIDIFGVFYIQDFTKDEKWLFFKRGGYFKKWYYSLLLLLPDSTCILGISMNKKIIKVLFAILLVSNLTSCNNKSDVDKTSIS